MKENTVRYITSIGGAGLVIFGALYLFTNDAPTLVSSIVIVLGLLTLTYPIYPRLSNIIN